MSGITNLVAAQLSAAAYTPLSAYSGSSAISDTQYIDGETGAVLSLPSGWAANLSLSDFVVKDGVTEQLITFVNTSTQQIVIAFKGTDTLTDLKNDVSDQGAGAYLALQSAALATLNSIKDNSAYTGYEIMTDGHSLGGGMAQTFAVENGLSGYGQNSLSIAPGSIAAYNTANPGTNFNTLHTNWLASGNTFSEVNTYGDPATAYYADVLNGTYISTSTSTLENPYFVGELLGIAATVAAPLSPIGIAVLAGSEAKSHSIDNVISLLSAGGASSTQVGLTTAVTDETMQAALSTTTTLNPDGSVSVTPLGSGDPTLSVDAVSTPPTAIGTLADNTTYLYDTVTGDSLTLVGDPDTATDPGLAVAYNSNDGSVLVFEQGMAGAGDLTLPNGLTINEGGTSDLNLVGIYSRSVSTLQALVDYLNQVGDSITINQLNALNDAYVVTPTSTNVLDYTTQKIDDTHATVTFKSEQNGDIVTGPATVTILDSNGNPVQVVPTNIFQAIGDITGDAISNIDIVEIGGDQLWSPIILTASQFSSFGDVTSDGIFAPAGVMKVVGGGTVDLQGANVDPDFTVGGLEADSWEGTTLIGNGRGAEFVGGQQVLQASLFGNDTLIASDLGNELIAGEGVDTLTGGTGDDNFEAPDGLTAGSSVTGGGGADVLHANGDITGATISGVQTLQTTGDLTLTATEFNSFSSIEDNNMIYAATSGAYDLSAKGDGGSMTALSDDGTTLIGGDADNLVLTASAFGDDSLIAGDGANVHLIATDTLGDVTLTVGDGDGDILNASGSLGDNTLTAGNGASDQLWAGDGVDTLVGGTGGDTFYAWDGLAPGSVVEGNGTGNVLDVNGDITGATISGVQTLEVDGNVTLTLAQYEEFSSVVPSPNSNLTIDVPFGGTYDVSSLGIGSAMLAATSDDGTTLIDTNAADSVTLIASQFGNDTLTVGDSDGNVIHAGSGVDTITLGSGGNDVVFADNGLAAGSSVTMSGTDGALEAQGDISGATLSGVHTFGSDTSATINSTQLTGFSTIVSGSILYAATGGTYDFSGKTTGDNKIYATSDAGTVLQASNAQHMALIASAEGDDSLIIGSGANAVLDASNTSGDVSLSSGSGSGDLLNVSGSSGNDTVSAGGGNNAYLDGRNSTGTISLIAGGGNNDIVDARGSTGAATLKVGGGTGGTIYAGLGVDAITAGTGVNDTVIAENGLAAGSSVTMHTSTSTLIAEGDISNATISGVHTLGSTTGVTLTAAQLASVSLLQAGTILKAATGGSYSMSGGRGTTGDTIYALSNAGTTLIAGNAQQNTLHASASGNDTLTAGNGNGDVLDANGTSGNDSFTTGSGIGDIVYAGTGVETISLGAGLNDIVYADDGLASGSSLVANETTTSKLVANGDISGASITGVHTLGSTTGVTLTAAQLAGFSEIADDTTINAASDGTYTLSGAGSDVTLQATGGTGTTLIGDDADGETLVASALGDDTLTAGNGNGDTLDASGNAGSTALTVGSGANDILLAGTGNDTLTGGGGYDTYKFGAAFGQDTITNNGGGAANGEIDFTSNAITDQNLWFEQSGNDLLIKLLGTNSEIDVSGWFGASAGAQVESINADGLSIDSQVALLVQEMATYATNNPGFNPASAASMPSDPTLQGAIAASWHA